MMVQGSPGNKIMVEEKSLARKLSNDVFVVVQ